MRWQLREASRYAGVSGARRTEQATHYIEVSGKLRNVVAGCPLLGGR
jgi:hypothetical protein